MASSFKIGIPRALFWYYSPDTYKVLWEALGFKVIQSPPTNKMIFEEGIKWAKDELCLPLKIFHGHIIFLKDKVDFIFIPRIVSIIKNGKKYYGCPKFIALPEVIKNSIPYLPSIITVDINLSKNFLDENAFMKLQNTMKLKKYAIKDAIQKMVKFNNMNKIYDKPKNKNARLKIGVVGHPYILYDSYLSMNLLNKLSSLGVEYITSAEISKETLESELNPDIDVYWIYERELLGAASFLSNNEELDGILYCGSFGCGPGAVITEIIQRKIIKNKKKLFFTLVMDENTGEAGVLTRIEAFCEIARIKKR